MATKSYILLGPPGSGKSTQAEFLCRELGLTHVDMGAELRAAAEEETPFAIEINEIIHGKKELVPDIIVYGVLSQVLMRLAPSQGVMLDGAPRRETQIDEVLHVLKVSGREVHKVIFIRLSEEKSIERISKRFKCFACGHPLILGVDVTEGDAPCPQCGGRIGQREDDTPEGVKKRYHIFHDDTLPVIEYFAKKGMLVEVDGSLPSEEASQFILSTIKEG